MRTIPVPRPFDLALTCAPVSWAGGRWPNVDWVGGALLWVGWEGDAAVWRRVSDGGLGRLLVDGSADAAGDRRWADGLLGLGQSVPVFADPVVAALADRFAGWRPFAYGSVFDGVVTSIVGQSISLASAAVTEARLSALFHPGLDVDDRRFWPLPRAEALAAAEPALVRSSGVTWRRAEALVAAARAETEGRLPTRQAVLAEPEAARAALRALPLVGPWTAESTLLWGIGLPDAYPTGDVALLRAARRAYGRAELDRAGLDVLAEGWRPARGTAARLLWTALLGVPAAA